MNNFWCLNRENDIYIKHIHIIYMKHIHILRQFSLRLSRRQQQKYQKSSKFTDPDKIQADNHLSSRFATIK
jgi:hypothetical protein